MWSLGLASLRNQGTALGTAFVGGLLGALWLRLSTELEAIGIAGLLLLLLYVVWSVTYGYEQGEQRHHLHLSLPLTRAQVAMGRILAPVVAHGIAYGLSALFLVWGNVRAGAPWSQDQLVLCLFNGLLLFFSISGFLLEELTARARSTRWLLVAISTTYMALIVLASGALGIFIAVVFDDKPEGDFQDLMTQWVFAHASSLSALLYLATLLMTLAAIQLYRLRPDLTQLTNCWAGIDAIWRGGD